MTASEEIKLQAKLLEWEAPKGLSANLKGYNTGNYIWVTNGIVVSRIYSPCYMLNVLPSLESIKGFTQLPEDAVKGWLTETRFKDKELGMLVRAKAIGTEAWVKEKYIKAFSKAEYDVWIAPKAIWLTEPDTREVVGVIADVRGIKL